MLQRVKEVQESDLRMDGALARNIQRVLAVTQADIDAAAAQGKSWLVKRVVKVNDPLDNLRGGTQLVIKQNSILPGQNVMRVLYSGNSKTVGPAVAPLSLPGAAADDILSLIAFGGTIQGVPDGYTQLDGITGDGNAYIYLGVTLDENDEVEVDFTMPSTATTSRSIFGYRYGASSNNIAVMIGGTGSLVCDWNNSDYATYRFTATPSAGARYKAVLDKTGRYLYDNNGNVVASNTTTCPDTIATSNVFLFYLGGNPAYTGENSKFNGTVHSVKVAGKCNLVPCKNASNEVGMYDTLNGVFYTAVIGSGTFTAGNEVAPTPTAPIDIVCNNGVLKFTANEANYIADNVTLGYWLRNSDGQPESSPSNFYTEMMPVKPNTSYVAFGRKKDTDVISGYNRIAWYDANGVWIRNSTYTQNQPGIDTSPADAAFARFHCNPSGSTVTQELVDSYNWVFQVGTAEVPYTPYSPTKVYAAGPIETIAIKDDQNATVSTATCEDLLSINTYTDQQEVISGAVTRKVGVKVLDGTENIGKSSQYAGSFFVRNVVQDWETSNNAQVFCSHFSCITAESSYAQNKCMILNNAFNMWWASDNTPTVAQFQQWLADQYAAGTPVMIVFPLATSTTESVTGQPMQTAAGDNTAEITQAGMAGLELEVEYVEA